MQMPGVENTIKDKEHNVTYRVLAYRPLSRAELVASVRLFNAQPKIRRRKRPITDKTITIFTLYGATD